MLPFLKADPDDDPFQPSSTRPTEPYLAAMGRSAKLMKRQCVPSLAPGTEVSLELTVCSPRAAAIPSSLARRTKAQKDLSKTVSRASKPLAMPPPPPPSAQQTEGGANAGQKRRKTLRARAETKVRWLPSSRSSLRFPLLGCR